jgi:hypothetical protein
MNDATLSPASPFDKVMESVRWNQTIHEITNRSIICSIRKNKSRNKESFGCEHWVSRFRLGSTLGGWLGDGLLGFSSGSAGER